MSLKPPKSATAILAAITVLSGCTLAEAGSNTGKAESNQFIADPSIAALLKKIEGQPPDQKKKAIIAFRLTTKRNAIARQKSAYVLARILQKGGTSAELKEAIPLFEEAAEFVPLTQRCRSHVADCANTLGNEPLVRSSLESLLAGSSDPLLRAQGKYGLAQSYLRAREESQAKREFENVLKLGAESQYALGARYYLGQAAFQSKNVKEGLKFWRDYLGKSPDGRFSREIVSALASAPGVDLLQADHRLFGDVYYAHGDWAKALAEWKIAAADDTWFKQANCLFRQRRTIEGWDLLRACLSDHAGEPDVAQAANLLARRGTKAEAISVWQTVLANSPAFEDMALYNLGYRAQDDESIDYYTKLTSKYPKSDFAPEASWWLAWDNMKEGRTAAALTELKSCTGKYDKSRLASRFYFWTGKLEEKVKHSEAAIKAYELTVEKYGNSYYGWRARARLAALSGKSDPGFRTDFNGHLKQYRSLQAKGGWTWPVPPSLISFRDIAEASNQAVACLAELQQWDECLELLPKDRLPELKAVCLARLNLVHDAINTMAHDLHGKASAEQKWQIAYPLLHSNIISSESAAKEVDPFLAHGLIRQESRYNTFALSASNAIGLMQLLPATAMGVAKRLKVTIKSQDDISKPEINLKLGIDYLSYLLDRFDGNALLAVASYNGGPNAVAGWKNKFGLEDPDSFVENIPLAETREYVREVFSGYWSYAAIYKGKTEAPEPGEHPEK